METLRVGIAAVLGLILIILALKRRSSAKDSSNSKLKLPPGSLGLPVVGESLQFLLFHDSFIKKRRKVYGDVFKTHIFGSPTIISTEADVNRFIMQNEGRLFAASYPASVFDTLGEFNMLAVGGELHKKMRAISVGFLSAAMIKDHLLGEVEDFVRSVLNRWKGQIINVQHETRDLTFHLIAKQILGYSPGEEADAMKWDYYAFTDAFFAVPFNIPGSTYHKGMQARARIVKKLNEIIETRRKLSYDPHNDVVATLINSEKDEDQKLHFSNKQTVDFLVGLLVAGHETAASAMMMAVKFITEHPKVLQEMREEHKAIRNTKERGEKLTWDDYKSMTFTQNVIYETLRMTNISHGLYRKATEDITLTGDYIVPKGWKLVAYYKATHLSENYFPDPMKFNPWRWQEKDVNGGYLTPFGGGNRYCPGSELARTELAIFLHYLVTLYRWEIAEEDKVRYFPTVRAAKGYPIKVSELN